MLAELPLDLAVVRFTVPGTIVPWARAGGRGHLRFTPAPQRSFMGAIRSLASEAMDGRPLIDGPCEMKILAVWPWPKSLSPGRRARPGAERKATTPDADNVSKIVKDSLNAIVFTDDARISDLHVFKRYGTTPGLTVEVRAL